MNGSSKINPEVELSIVMPCYNEEKVLNLSIPPLLELLNVSCIKYEIVLVNNGSWDSTPGIIDSFAAKGYPVRHVDVPVNIGYGWGVICGLNAAVGKYTGYMSADGQVKAEDVLKLFEIIRNKEKGVMVAAVRVNRADGWHRKIVSRIYNVSLFVFFGRIGRDANGTPRIFHHEDLALLKPENKGSFIDPEILIKSKAMKMKVIEIPVTFHKREGGTSTVRVISKSIEFLKDMVKFRFSKQYNTWLKTVQSHG
jgi:polyisoprenyl-phosphate glycosyltransferase